MKTDTRPSRDIHSEITTALITAIESEPGKFSLPWHRGEGLSLPSNAVTGSAYNGVNIISLWVAAQSLGFEAPLWATYRQWAEKGAQVRKGEKASLVVFFKEFEGTPNPDGELDTGKRRVAKASYVFNAAQVEGFEVPATSMPTLEPIERLEAADRFADGTGAAITFGGSRAYYSPEYDLIRMPDEERFAGTSTMTRQEGYYATLLHELIHWSGSRGRLARDLSGRFGDQAYAAEELVAEIGAAFLCAELRITPELRADHAQYLASWVAILKSDNKAIFAAAAKASEATRYLKGLTGVA